MHWTMFGRAQASIKIPEPLGTASLHRLARRFRVDAVAEELGIRS